MVMEGMRLTLIGVVAGNRRGIRAHAFAFCFSFWSAAGGSDCVRDGACSAGRGRFGRDLVSGPAGCGHRSYGGASAKLSGNEWKMICVGYP